MHHHSRLIIGATGLDIYEQLVTAVVRYGEPNDARGMPTRDIGWMTLAIETPTYPLPLGIGRGVNRRIAAAEAIQLIGAFSDPKLLIDASPTFARFLEPDTGKFHGAYGVRIGDQLRHVVRKITADRATRQAVISLWDPWLDNQAQKRDYPCTLTLDLKLTPRNAVDLAVTMRSQDVIWGTPYDLFQFQQLQQTVATALHADVGMYFHTTHSTHIYEEFVPRALELRNPPPLGLREWQPCGIGRDGDTIDEIIARARRLPYADLPDMTPSERWYARQLRPDDFKESDDASTSPS